MGAHMWQATRWLGTLDRTQKTGIRGLQLKLFAQQWRFLLSVPQGSGRCRVFLINSQISFFPVHFFTQAWYCCTRPPAFLTRSPNKCHKVDPRQCLSQPTTQPPPSRASSQKPRRAGAQPLMRCAAPRTAVRPLRGWYLSSASSATSSSTCARAQPGALRPF